MKFIRNAILLLGALIAGTAQAQVPAAPPINTKQFVNLFGMNTHVGNSATVYFNNPTAIKTAMTFLGFGAVRDTIFTGYNTTSYNAMLAGGLKYDPVLNLAAGAANASTPAAYIAAIHQLAVANPGAVISVEGPNEVANWPVTFNSLTGIPAANAFQGAVFADVRADSVLGTLPVFMYTFGGGTPQNPANGNQSANATDGNAHVYPQVAIGGGITPYTDLAANVPFQNSVIAPSLPAVITEGGYYTSNVNSYGVDNNVQMRYLLDYLFDTAVQGYPKTYLYELFDNTCDPGNTNSEFHFGVFNCDFTPKPSATAIHNLTQILTDPGTPTSSPVAFTVTGLPNAALKLGLAKSNGTTDVVVWAEPVIWNQSTHTEIVPPTNTVTVSLSKVFPSVKVYDPTIGTTPQQTLTNVAVVTVQVTDHPLVIEASNGQQIPPPPAAAAGYNVLNFGPNVTVGSNWFIDWQNTAGANVTQNADGSVTVAGGNNNFGNQLTTIKSASGPQSYVGTTFTNGAYFEVTASIAGGPINQTGGWPAFWSDDLETNWNGGTPTNAFTQWQGQAANFGRSVETDFIEFDVAGSTTQVGNNMHDWYGVPVFGASNFPFNSTVTAPAGFDFSKPHKYGFLWIPATNTTQGSGQWYMDNVLTNTVHWNKYNPALAPPPVLGTTAFSEIDVRHIYPILGSGPNNPMTISAVTVWQAPPPPGVVPVPAPLTGTVTLNNWQSFDQTFSGITLACGKPFHFNLAQPPQYNPLAYKYPLYIWLHADFQGDAWYTGQPVAKSGPLQLANLEGGLYNTVSWMTQFPAFYALPYADQSNGNGTSGSCTGDGNDAVQNWGGWFNNGSTGSGTHYSGDTGPNTFALLDMITFLEQQYSIDASRIYVNGFSLGAIGSGYLCQHYNLINGSPAIFAACLESGGGVDNADTPVTSATIAKMQSVPKWAFSGANDTQSPPGSYNTPLCNGLGDNAATTISSPAANRCGTSQMRYTLCPSCGHQETDANGAAVWTNIAMNTFAFAQGGGGGPNPATAQRSADFLNMLAVKGGISTGGAPFLNASQQVADMQFLGVTHYQDNLGLPMSGANLTALQALINGGISMDAQVQYGVISPATQIAQAQAWQALGANPQPTPPAVAAAVGYNTMTLGPNISLGTVANPTTSYPQFDPGVNWVPFTFFGTSWKSIGAVQNSDGSVTLDGSGEAYGNGLSTAEVGTGTPSRTNILGTAFGGGAYFEATMKFNGPASFWLNDIENMNGASQGLGNVQWPGQAAGYGDWLEVDMAEFDLTNRYGWAAHNWYGIGVNDVAPNWGGPIGTCSPLGSPSCIWSPPAGVDYTQYNKYGFLWVPATATTQGYAKFFFNGFQVGNTITWNQYNAALGPPPVAGAVINSVPGQYGPVGQTVANSAWSVMDTRHLALILGGQTGGGSTNTISSVQVWQASSANNITTVSPPAQVGATAVYSIEGIPDPTKGSVTYNGVTGGQAATWKPIADYMIAYKTAVASAPSLAPLPFFGVSNAGAETNNVGLQYVQVPTPLPSGVLEPAGSVMTQYFSGGVFPTDQNTLGAGVVSACQPNDPIAGNAFNINTHWNAVQTSGQGFAGYATDAIAQSQPRVVTAFGYPTLAPAPSANGDRVTEDKKGRCILNGLLTAWQLGTKMVSINSIYDLSGAGFGLMAGSGSPNLSGSYLHDLTTILADTGATARTFTPGILNYGLTGLPATGGQQLFQKSNGHWQLVLWNNATNWNITTGTPITVPAVSVAVNFSGGTNFTMTAFDTVSGVNPIQTITSGNAITVAVSDYPVVIDVVPANTSPETITVSAIATQVATTPFTVSGSIANANGVPTLQYSVNGGTYQPLPVSGGSRDPYQQPGSNNSVWNIPFGSGATWTSATDPQTLALCAGTCVGILNPVSNFGETRYTSTSASDPTFSFTTSTNGRTVAPDNGSTLSATMHVPVGAFTPGPYPGDNPLVLMDKTSFPNRVYTWSGITPAIQPPGLQTGQGPFNAVEGAEWDDITSDLFGQDYDSGLSGFDLAAGMITGCDTDPTCNPFFPQIKHGLRYMLPVTIYKSNAVPGSSQVLNPSGWPDRLEDFQAGGELYTGNFLFGNTLGIPLTTAMPAGLDANCQGLFWTFQHYPSFPRDAAAGGFHLTVDQTADTSAWAASARGCISQLTGLLRVLTNQHQGGQSFTTQPANGPGTRVDTGPLALSGGTANVTQTSFFFTVPGLAANSVNTISVRDANAPTVVGTSNQFIVSGGPGSLTGTPKSPLSSGYFHVSGNQIVDGSGNNVRIACSGYNEPTGNYGSDMSIMRNQGFNCVRYPLYDATVCPNGTCGFGTLDAIVSAALANNMRVIFDHHGNEPSCGGQQQNGLWYDVNSSTPVAGVTWNTLTQNVDGCGHAGTVTYARFRSNWVQIAQHYAGNSTVIGFDLDNEAFIGLSFQVIPVNWGGNNGSDEHLMCQDTGSAIEAADPGALIICEGPINLQGPFLDGTAFPSGARNIMDLTKAGSTPVVLAGDAGSHVVYSIHDYPNDISGNTPDSGTAGAQFRIKAYAFLHAANTAPVWIGEIGASLDGTVGSLSDDQGWATMMTALINGQDGAIGGPTFTGCQQPMGTDWWNFGKNAGQAPDGTLNADGSNRAGQQAVYSTFLYTTCSQSGGPGGGPPPGVGSTTWNPADKSANMTLDTTNLIATDSVTANSNSVRTNTSSTSGKLYFEVKATTSSTNWSVGIANASFPLTASGGLGSEANGIGFYNVSPAQSIYYNATQLHVGSTPGATGDIIYLAVDLTNHLLWVSSPVMRAASTPWNDLAIGSANPATGVGGASFAGLTCPCFPIFNSEDVGSQATINAGGPFNGTVPTGFVAFQAPVTSGNHPILINLGN